RVGVHVMVGVVAGDPDQLQYEEHADQAEHHQERQVPPVIEEREETHGTLPRRRAEQGIVETLRTGVLCRYGAFAAQQRKPTSLLTNEAGKMSKSNSHVEPPCGDRKFPPRTLKYVFPPDVT